MGRRLSGFDYSRPYFYMVTIKRRKEAQALSDIVAPGRCETNAITRAFVNCVRTFHEGCKAIARAERIGPGGAGVGTFLSPLEKACGHALGLAGGRWVVLSPEGFGERWHPGRAHEPFCADGRMLYLSLYPAMARSPTKQELYDRCHEMGALVKSGLAADE